MFHVFSDKCLLPFSSSLLSRFLPLAPFSSLSPSSFLPYSILLYPPHSRDHPSLLFSLSILSSLDFRSPFSFFPPFFFLSSLQNPPSFLSWQEVQHSRDHYIYHRSISVTVRRSQFTCHYMVCTPCAKRTF